MVNKKKAVEYLKTFEKQLLVYESKGIRLMVNPGRKGIQTDKKDPDGKAIWENIVAKDSPVTIGIRQAGKYISIDPLDFTAMLNALIKNDDISNVIDYWASNMQDKLLLTLGVQGDYNSPFPKKSKS